MDSKNFLAILDLLNSSGGKYIIIENGKPAFVLMDFDEYKKLVSDQNEMKNLKEELVKKINRDIALWRVEQQKEKERAIPDKKEDPEYFFKAGNNFENDLS